MLRVTVRVLPTVTAPEPMVEMRHWEFSISAVPLRGMEVAALPSR